MVGSDAKKYRVSTTMINTEKPTLTTAVPKPRIPPSRAVILVVSETNLLTSVVRTVATSNSSSMARKKSEAIKAETTVGNIWKNSVVCSTITGISVEIKTVTIPKRMITAAATPTPRGAPQDWIFVTIGSSPNVMKNAARIHTNSWTLDDTNR